MNRCEDCPDWEEIYMSEMKKPEKGGTPKKITTKKKPGATGPGGETPARDRGKSSSAYNNQTTDSNNK